MREVAADAGALDENLVGGLRRTRMWIAELDVIMAPVDDRLDPRPTRWAGAEELPRGTLQPVDLAVAAGEQEGQGRGRQLCDGMLLRMRPRAIEGAVVGDDGGVVEAELS